MKKTIEIMKKMGDKDAKSMLKIIFLMLDQSEDQPEAFQQHVQKCRDDYWEMLKHQDSSIELIHSHIVFGDSIAGALKQVLPPKHEVISIDNRLDFGPIWDLHVSEGVKKRKQWLFNNINMDEEELFNYEDLFIKKLNRIRNIPNDRPVTVWYGDNAFEQTGLRFVHYILEHHPSVDAINATQALHNMSPDRKSLHTGEIHPRHLERILNDAKRQRLGERWSVDWKALSQTKGILRFWKDGDIVPVPEDALDTFILRTLDNIQRQSGSYDFIKSARLIGEVMGTLDHVVNDSFLEFRIRTLIYDGILEIRGVPRAMRFYEVRRKGTN
ncbi:DUF1835 domain-containing protein [Halobacillus salinus]|uniref:DUF1835 domain-containing protein n=1 Tax=Halobacillus salinus TaxID=192814 RepID=A0A4Z0H1D6_9BACI|nr:DUF1835 domain-containing protein [Halobacillus salinus]TGB03799.1 DUF1835 domain-containing protein [Halobacillus salinus]